MSHEVILRNVHQLRQLAENRKIKPTVNPVKMTAKASMYSTILYEEVRLSISQAFDAAFPLLTKRESNT